MSAPPLDTHIAGLRCRDVLGALSDYLDGEMDPAQVQALTEHLAGCVNCTRFGTHMNSLLTRFRVGVPLPAVDNGLLQRVLDQVEENR
jgi:anti-sigma factor RsiW